MAVSWRKRLGTLPVTPSGFHGGRNGVWLGFSRGFSRFPYHKFHSSISPHLSHSFSFILSVHVMVRQTWFAGTLAIHGPTISGLHRISSLDPTLCWTRTEDIYLLFEQSYSWMVLLMRTYVVLVLGVFSLI